MGRLSAAALALGVSVLGCSGGSTVGPAAGVGPADSGAGAPSGASGLDGSISPGGSAGKDGAAPSSIDGAAPPDATGSTPGNGAPPFGVAQSGVATYYGGDGTGACSFDADPSALDFAAMDQPEWAGSAVCGACAAVVGPTGNVTVRIVDLCPGCESGHLDLSPQAFQKISPLSAGKVPITWTLVPCQVSGNVEYRYKDGSSQYWTAIQVLNHRLPIAKLEWKTQTQTGYADVALASYDYLRPQSSGVGTKDGGRVRITAWDGQVLEDTLPAVGPSEDGGTVVTGGGQF